MRSASGGPRATRYEAVASYQSAEGAAAAAVHLVEHGYDPSTIAIRPAGFAPLEHRGVVRRLSAVCGRWVLAGAVLGLLAGLAQLVGVHGFVATVLPAVGAAAALGFLAGVAAFAGAVRRERWSAVDDDGLAPTRFEVAVQERSPDARHDLARWWDADAPPAASRAS
jgi:hypothetical protein